MKQRRGCREHAKKLTSESTPQEEEEEEESFGDCCFQGIVVDVNQPWDNFNG